MCAPGRRRGRVENGDLALELPRQHHVVPVQPGDELAAHDLERPVERERLAAVVRGDKHPDAARIALGE